MEAVFQILAGVGCYVGGYALIENGLFNLFVRNIAKPKTTEDRCPRCEQQTHVTITNVEDAIFAAERDFATLQNVLRTKTQTQTAAAEVPLTRRQRKQRKSKGINDLTESTVAAVVLDGHN